MDHLHEGDLALLESARLGKPVLLLVRGHVRAKTFKLAGPTSDEHMAFVCSVRVDSIEDAGGA